MSPRSSSTCPICHSNNAYPIESQDRKGAPLTVVICTGCGVVHNDPIPTPVELEHFYSEAYRKTYKGTHQPRLRHAARYFPAVAQHIRTHWSHYQSRRHILDVGSGSGEFVFLMQSLGKQVTGLEPTRDYADFCRNTLQIPIITGAIHDFQPDSPFDHIRLNHVVEHLADPVSSLKMIADWLSPGGTIYVEVPDFEQYCRSKTPGRMFHYGHIFNFDRCSFTRMVTEAGLQIIERTGHTAAFLAPTDGHPSPADGWPVQEKLHLYEQHRQGMLRNPVCSQRIMKKALKALQEHRLILRHPSHLGIARQAAQSLQSLPSTAP